ncbi:hypothetical protein O3P69_001258 [Scylla paramamosain]|uniref:Late endosomal/lysosomal adaptor and MAPK and MTOR activator 5 n=1 Tax=Scylla paramamosain TaxID=85552 RepID=A0AAW0UUQ5_SCYPA
MDSVGIGIGAGIVRSNAIGLGALAMTRQSHREGRWGAQMMGLQSSVCIITCADGSRHLVVAGIHGRLVEVE